MIQQGQIETPDAVVNDEARALVGFICDLDDGQQSDALSELASALGGGAKLTLDRIAKVISRASDAHKRALGRRDFATAKKIEDDLWRLDGSVVGALGTFRQQFRHDFSLAADRLVARRAEVDGTVYRTRELVMVISMGLGRWLVPPALASAQFQWRTDLVGRHIGLPNIAFTLKANPNAPAQQQKADFEKSMKEHVTRWCKDVGLTARLSGSSEDQRTQRLTLYFDFERSH